MGSARIATLGRALLLAAVLVTVPAAGATASSTQEAILQDDISVISDAPQTFARLRLLGVTRVRLSVRWQLIAPNPYSRRRPHFDASDPAAYPASNWSLWDTIDKDAARAGIELSFDLVGGAPRWAAGRGAPAQKFSYWDPSASEFAKFVRAAGTRYSGTYDPALKRSVPADPRALPRISYWSIWNEPDYGPTLAPQGLPGHLTIEHSPRMYRGLVDAAWAGLHATGHGKDTILFGELAPRGEKYWGVFSGMKPLVFLRALYCVDSSYHQLRGIAAALRGCPTTAAGSRRFRAAHPALFQASGLADHPYMRWYPPNQEQKPDPNYASLGEIGNLERALDRLQHVYGSPTRFPIYDTEFGYITSPPKHDNRFPWVSQQNAAYYLNWAEYLHWRNPRIRSFQQYLLYDELKPRPSNEWGGFASGLLNYYHHEKPGYAAWRLPLYLPSTTAPSGRVEVWGCVRPARYALLDTHLPQTAYLQFQSGFRGRFTNLQSITIRDPNNCYFDLHVKLPASGALRLSWDYPRIDVQYGYFDPLQSRTVYSRNVKVTFR